MPRSLTHASRAIGLLVASFALSVAAQTAPTPAEAAAFVERAEAEARAASPARASALPSGTTTKLPVNTTRSPAPLQVA